MTPPTLFATVSVRYQLDQNMKKKLPAALAGALENIQPELPLTLVEFAPAYHVAPPVAALSFKLR